jgi:CRISPR/Cas system CSM-associated protein Csm3 (group 7 of RAMP superfamily)
MSSQPQWNNSRQVVRRIFVSGKLVLETPAHIGNGDAEGIADIPLLVDPLDGKSPLLTGASIAGALRNYIRDVQKGYGWLEQRQAKDKSDAEQLFGCMDDTQNASVESWLMVDDALGCLPENHVATEIRDGVAIDPRTRTVEEDERGGHKFDIELLPAGTSFDLAFEFWQTEGSANLLPALAVALQGFQLGQIGLGMRKRRGFGQCRLDEWQVWDYPMTSKAGLMGWLNHPAAAFHTTGRDILQLLGNPDLPTDNRESFSIEAWFALLGSLLIRSEGGLDDPADTAHLKSWRPEGENAVLPGTSLAGVVRSRALRIANTMLGREKGHLLVDEMFGRRIQKHTDQPSGSQLLVRETVIENTIDERIQSRAKIDRFTGGAYPQALFTQQPLWADGFQRQVHVHLELRRLQCAPKEKDAYDADFKAKAGLLLLVLKDLWSGDLPLGGEASVGRGRLQGLESNLTHHTPGGKKTWTLIQKMDSNAMEELEQEDRQEMETYIQAFIKWTPLAQAEREVSQ